ncbi:hypothetical protein F3Y22_tig00013738pilonHSYRG00072 [Hibiscus syriacus]|uniref:Uncharacterized protein n=1 Tax=Hibiscus syriacus TaxID=106335 RepID=A0A6A3C167_HIBSY|nr:hypothetical protein F3Y22_tig00013738pilonHSYRG00072 [Hibiscus syriacus]
MAEEGNNGGRQVVINVSGEKNLRGSCPKEAKALDPKLNSQDNSLANPEQVGGNSPYKLSSINNKSARSIRVDSAMSKTLSITSRGSTEEDENEEIVKKVKLHKERLNGLKPKVVIQWFVFVLLFGCLITSLTIAQLIVIKAKKGKEPKTKRLIDMGKVHRLKREKVSAWHMKLLVDANTKSGLSTVSNTLEESACDEGGKQAYNEITNEEEETGWKYIHGDVFRFPEHKSLFAAALGSGTIAMLVLHENSLLTSNFFF